MTTVTVTVIVTPGENPKKPPPPLSFPPNCFPGKHKGPKLNFSLESLSVAGRRSGPQKPKSSLQCLCAFAGCPLLLSWQLHVSSVSSCVCCKDVHGMCVWGGGEHEGPKLGKTGQGRVGGCLGMAGRRSGPENTTRLGSVRACVHELGWGRLRAK